MRRKADLDFEVSKTISRSKKTVSLITDAFVQEIRRALVEDGVVHLDGFGKLHVVEERGKLTKLQKGTFKRGQRAGTIVVDVPMKLRVHFRKAVPFEKQLRENWKLRRSSK